MTKFCREDESSYIKGHLWSFGFPFQDRGRINRQQHQKAVREAGRTDARSAVSGTKITLLRLCVLENQGQVQQAIPLMEE